MADNALLKKLNVRSGSGIRLLNLPENLRERLDAPSAEHSATLLFVYSIADIEGKLPDVIKQHPADNYLWIAFPKKTSSIKTDLSRDSGWETVTSLGYRTVNLIAIDNDWSAFRIQPIGTHVRIPRDPALPRPDLIVPEALKERLAHAPAAQAVFEKLSYSHKKEYIVWIEDAKRPETKEKRLTATIEKLSAGVKSPIR